MQIQVAIFSFRFCVRFENSSNNEIKISVSSWAGNGDVSKTSKGRNSFHEKFPLSVFLEDKRLQMSTPDWQTAGCSLETFQSAKDSIAKCLAF